MLLENTSYPADRRVFHEATTLVADGHSVTVICRRAAGQPWHEITDGVAVYRYPAPRDGDGLLGYLWEYAWSMCAIAVMSTLVVVRHGFDVVHAHNPPDLLCLIALPYKLLGKKFVFDHHDLAPEMYRVRFPSGGNRLVRRILEMFERLSCRMADHVIATNESYKRRDSQRHALSEHRITVVRNGPELSRFSPSRATSDAAARVVRNDTLVYVGAMSYQDGVEYLLRAVKHLVHTLNRREVKCVLVGDGSEKNHLMHLVETFKLAGHVEFTGFVEPHEVPQFLGAAALGLAPEPANDYNNRSTMIKVMEYMAMALPVVAFDLPETRVTAGDAALYARPNDERDFAAKIVQLLDDPGLRSQLGSIGRHRIETKWAWPIQGEELLRMYAGLNGRSSD